MNKFKEFITESESDLEKIFTEIDDNIKDHWKRNQYSVRSRKLTKIKKSNNHISSEFKCGSNTQRPMFDEDDFSYFIESITSGLIQKGKKLYCILSYDSPSRNRMGQISGPSLMYFEISQDKMPRGNGSYDLIKFVVDGEGNRVGNLEEIKKSVPKESNNRYADLMSVEDNGDNFVLKIRLEMPYMKDKSNGAPTKEYDNTISDAIEFYEDIAKSLSKELGVGIIVSASY